MNANSLAGEFYYDSFDIDTENDKVLFYYSTDSGHSFTHELGVSFNKDTNKDDLLATVFSLGMAELVGYWKAILSPKIIVKAGALTGDQVSFWGKLYKNGLGEFFYKNEIDFRDLINIESQKDAPAFEMKESEKGGALVPFGGGKDSLISGEILNQKGKDFTWFELEPLPFSKKLQEISGETKSISIQRDVKKNFQPILDLVKAGAPNGHVPITSVYIFSAVLIAKINGFSDVVLSLERSADEGNTDYLGLNINHQYSKSFEFEKEVNSYVKNYIDSNIEVFSLLRPLYEIQILERFSKLEKYFPYFISCNKGLKTGTWCGECAKCAFMFVGLSAFLEPTKVENIFGKNLLDDKNLLQTYKEMIGLGETKPFDCIGTFKENLLAMYLAGEQYKKAQIELPSVLNELPISKGKENLGLLDEFNKENIIPKEYLYEN